MIFYLAALLIQDVPADSAQALRDTAKKGTFAFSGELKIQSEDMGMDVTASIEGAASSPFGAIVKSKAEKSTYEIFHKGGKTVERLTWRGFPEYMEMGTSDEVLSLLDLEKLAAAAAKGKSGKKDADDNGSSVFRLTLGEDAIRSYNEDGMDGVDFGMKVDSVALKLWIKDGLVQKMEAAVERSYDDGGGDTYATTTVYTLTLSKHGEAKVEYPADIVKELGE